MDVDFADVRVNAEKTKSKIKETEAEVFKLQEQNFRV